MSLFIILNILSLGRPSRGDEGLSQNRFRTLGGRRSYGAVHAGSARALPLEIGNQFQDRSLATTLFDFLHFATLHDVPCGNTVIDFFLFTFELLFRVRFAIMFA